MSTALRPIGHEDRLSLVEHLDELRTRLILCIVALAVCFSFTYWQNDKVLEILNDPLKATQNLDGDAKKSNDPLEQAARFQKELGVALRALGPALTGIDGSIQRLGGADGLADADRAALREQQRQLQATVAAVAAASAALPTNLEKQPITLGPAEPFLTTFTVTGYSAVLLALPFLLYQMYAFVLPAFSPKERKAALPLMAMVPVLFIIGVVFAYFVALPPALNFLQNFNDDNFDILVRAQDYYRFILVLVGGIGLLFQIPVGVLAVTRLGIISVKQLRKNRGYVLIGIAVLAAVVTPTPDPVTMTVSMLPLVLLFELSILLASLFERRRAAEDEDAPDDDELDLTTI